MSFLLRDKQPQSLYHACEIAMDIECNLKYGFIRRRTPTVVEDFPEISVLNTCVDEVSLFHWRDKSFLDECNPHVSSITTVDDRIDSFDKVHMQDINLVSSSPSVELIHVENIIDYEVEGSSS